MTWAAAQGVCRGNVKAIAIITSVNSKILGSQKFEYRPSSAKSRLKKAEKLGIEKYSLTFFALGRIVS
jgi:hypothetical protein